MSDATTFRHKVGQIVLLPELQLEVVFVLSGLGFLSCDTRSTDSTQRHTTQASSRRKGKGCEPCLVAAAQRCAADVESPSPYSYPPQSAHVCLSGGIHTALHEH